MMIVAIVTTAAASMIWQQWRAVQVEAAERARAQSMWILNGALDWGRMILREDARAGGADHLGEPWALPLAEARLSTFLAADAADADDGPEAFLSGHIVDAQSRYNLHNLFEGGKVLPVEVHAFTRLLESLELDTSLAARIATSLNAAAGIRPAADTNRGSADAASGPQPLMPQSLAQLAWLGVDAESIERLAPYVVLLPTSSAVNLNTAPREVLMTAIDGLDAGSAERLVQTRQRTPFRSAAEATALLPQNVKLDGRRAGVSSRYFELHGRLRLEDRILDEIWLVRRDGANVLPLQRRQVSTREVSGG